MSEPDAIAGFIHANVQRLQLEAGAVQQEQVQDALAQEVPVALVYNGIAHAVMMATPLDLEDFARGFSLSERIVENPRQIYSIDVISHYAPNGLLANIEIQLDIASQAFIQLKDKRRMLAGRTGCGVCGVESLAALDLDLPAVSGSCEITLAAILRAQQQLQTLQSINQHTGAVHAAAWVNLQGDILQLREDVGRHNALDKLIGALALAQREVGFCLLTSRASYELVQKAARANIALLATVSAPTSLAVQLAEQAGMTLLGFVRGTRAVLYAGAQRVVASD